MPRQKFKQSFKPKKVQPKLQNPPRVQTKIEYNNQSSSTSSIPKKYNKTKTKTKAPARFEDKNKSPSKKSNAKTNCQPKFKQTIPTQTWTPWKIQRKLQTIMTVNNKIQEKDAHENKRSSTSCDQKRPQVECQDTSWSKSSSPKKAKPKVQNPNPTKPKLNSKTKPQKFDLCMYVCMNAWMHVCMSVYIFKYTYLYIYIHVCVWMRQCYVYAGAFMFTWFLCIFKKLPSYNNVQ